MSRNRYEKIRILGAGSYGEAWLVKSSNSQRQYVVKEMKMLPNLTQAVGIHFSHLLFTFIIYHCILPLDKGFLTFLARRMPQLYIGFHVPLKNPPCGSKSAS